MKQKAVAWMVVFGRSIHADTYAGVWIWRRDRRVFPRKHLATCFIKYAIKHDNEFRNVSDPIPLVERKP